VGTDLSPYIVKVNAIQRDHPVFHEESPTSILPSQNPNVLLMWKASVKHKDEALLILNKDRAQHQEFHTDHFRHLVQAGAPLRDVSPEYPLEYFHRILSLRAATRPGHRAGHVPNLTRLTAALPTPWGRPTLCCAKSGTVAISADNNLNPSLPGAWCKRVGGLLRAYYDLTTGGSGPIRPMASFGLNPSIAMRAHITMSNSYKPAPAKPFLVHALMIIHPSGRQLALCKLGG
jgi:hypothetical protein